jgi:tryptophan synthase beta chain
MTPLLKMHTLGRDFMPSPIQAGGLRYHGTAPALSMLLDTGTVEPRAVEQLNTFQVAEIFAKTEGLVSAPETVHAIHGAIDLVVEAKRENEERVISFNHSGHGLLDMESYAQYLAGNLGDCGD